MSASPVERLRARDAVLAVDVQPDFCPGGALAVAGGDAIVPVLNAWLRAARERGVVVCASRDWHPPGHVSFHAQGGPWPAHCVQGTPGAAFHPALELPDTAIRVDKGVAMDRDQYSAFDGTGLGDALREHGVDRLWLGGLALDVCVRATALDALAEGFAVRLIRAAVRAVEPEAAPAVIEELTRAGVVVADD